MLHNVPFVQTTSPESFRCFLVWYPGKSPLDIPFSPWSPQSWTLHSPSWDRWRWQPVQLLLIQSEWGQSLQFWGGRGHWGHSKLSNIPLEQKQLVQGSSLSVPINELGQNDWNLVSSFSTRVQSFGTYQGIRAEWLKSSFFFQYQYIVKQKGNEVKENDQQGAFVSMYHSILKEQAKIGHQGRNVIWT